MSITEYLESSPLNNLVKYNTGQKTDTIPFCGALRQHPYDDKKCLLIIDPSETDPVFFEFRVADVLAVDEMPSPVNSEGSALRLVRLWVHKGSIALRYEPFEVGTSPDLRGSAPIHERIIRSFRSGNA